MQGSPILADLNEAQREAVTTGSAQALVLAGAGSGKTRVLVHRIAWCLETGLAAPNGILAVTFTNKAAAEMRARIEELLARPIGGMWVGTFHGIANRLLRAHAREAALPETFQILDSDDQQRLLRRVVRGMNLDDGEWQPRELQWFINARKDDGQRPEHIDTEGDPGLTTLVDIYRNYEAACQQSGLVDFAELLLRSFELWRDNPGLLQHYRDRFLHVLVDEFQDTNAIQYGWLRQLVGTEGSFFAVGDDDQSIYSWRGARVENMQRFQRDYAASQLVRLEQNYRSTGTILKAANALIANNSGRIGKDLWTAGEDGARISLYSGFNDIDEARYCIERVARWHDGGGRHDDCAILYRTSAQSRVIEDALRQADMPYRVHGGFRFYERAEIKDALAYLRLGFSRADDAAFERIVSVPPRGIGQRTIEALRYIARNEQCALWEAARRIVTYKELGARAVGALERFLALIDRVAAGIDADDLGTTLEHAIELSGLVDHYKKEKGDRGLDRIDNLEELLVAARDYKPGEEAEEMPLISAFLSHAALEAGEGQADEHEDSVQLMTLHSAKGLEFPNVFLVGLEEGLFPHQRSTDDPAQLEEERRLCYVGMTRAMEQLTITYAECRRLHGSEFYPRPSRFIREVPVALIEQVRLGGRAAASPLPGIAEGADSGLSLGQRVLHKTFGEGIVLRLEGRGEHTRVHVNFEDDGIKCLVAAYAGLQTL